MKKFGIALAFVALAAAIGIGAGYIFTNNTPSLSKEEAQQIALKDAGVKVEDAQGLRVQLENEDGMKYYDVSFATKKENDTARYDYDIDAETGAIYAKESAHSTSDKPVHASQSQGTQQQAEGEITADQAKQIALQHAGVNEADTLYVNAEYDREHTVNEWNVEFETATTEYDYDINAADGSILKSSNEPRG